MHLEVFEKGRDCVCEQKTGVESSQMKSTTEEGEKTDWGLLKEQESSNPGTTEHVCIDCRMSANPCDMQCGLADTSLLILVCTQSILPWGLARFYWCIYVCVSRSPHHPSTPCFRSSEMPKDREPIKSFRLVKSQSQISTDSLRSLSDSFRLL